MFQLRFVKRKYVRAYVPLSAGRQGVDIEVWLVGRSDPDLSLYSQLKGEERGREGGRGG
jgi:hypothetical protein